MKFTTALTMTAMLLTTAAPLSAETIRWARSGDALTLDPHAQNEGPTHTIRHQMYEPLIIRDVTGAFVPTLATDWAPKADDPNVWVFNLRQGVKFHDGADFTAEDVVFSFERAKQPNSDMKELIGSITEVRATGDYTVEIVTDGPNPILPSNLTNLFMMDKTWTEANNTVKVQDFEGGEITHATLNVNGTGPYTLTSREPDVKTVMTRNDNYWGINDFPMEVTEIVYTPIQNAATRVAAMLSGEIDFLQDMPVQDLERVRKAMSMAINRDAIKQVVMRGQSEPAGMIAPPFVNGWTAEMDAESSTDIEGAKALMEEAGYADGFSIRLDCPNDRYVNDEGICQAAVGMLGQIGVTVNLDAKPKAQHFPLITDGKTDFYMLGWGVPTYDSEYIFNFLVHGREAEIGTWNGTGFNDADLNATIKSLASNTDLEARNADIASIWRTVQDEALYIPIHHQVLNWGMAENVGIEVDAEDQPKVKYFTMK